METSLSRAFCELHMILSLLHALTPKHFSSIAQALICWDLSYCQVQCLNQYTNRLDKSTSHKFLSRSQYGITNQEKKIKGLLESLIHEMLLWSYEENMFFFGDLCRYSNKTLSSFNPCPYLSIRSNRRQGTLSVPKY